MAEVQPKEMVREAVGDGGSAPDMLRDRFLEDERGPDFAAEKKRNKVDSLNGQCGVSSFIGTRSKVIWCQADLMLTEEVQNCLHNCHEAKWEVLPENERFPAT